jgi:hypothetical protein
MHRFAITPEPPNRAAAADTHILNSNQTAKATAEIFKYDFFIPTPTDRYNFLIFKNRNRPTAKF